MLDDAVIRDYQSARPIGVDRSVLCHAPFTSLNFEQNGQARVCCYNIRAPLGTWPAASVKEMWEGAQAVALRRSFLEGTTATGCDLCFDQLRDRNFGGALMLNFDRLSLTDDYRPELQPHAPRVVEFELSNTCNLECIQCQAKWSSLIRRNRDRLPTLPMPYDERFVDQLEPYLPSLIEARFLGGEPMLIRLYHQIWERIRAVNPAIVLSITTNASVIPDRAFAVLSDLRAHICLSIDSLDPRNYARIRRNGSLDVVLANFERWRAYTQARGTGVSISVCPMTYNWRDLPAFLPFAERHDAPLWFNTVSRPWRASLASLQAAELDEVASYLASFESAVGERNRGAWQGLVGQVRAWRDARRMLDARLPGFVSSVHGAAHSRAALLARPDDGDDSPECVADGAARLLAASWLTETADDRELADRLVQMTPPGNIIDALPVEQTTLLRMLVLFQHLGLLRSAAPVAPAAVNEARLILDLETVDRRIREGLTQAEWDGMWDRFPDWAALATWLDAMLSGHDTDDSARG